MGVVICVYVACCMYSAWTYNRVIENMSYERYAQVDWTRYTVLVLMGPLTLLNLLVGWCWLKYKSWQRQRRLFSYIQTELKKELDKRGIELVD